MTAITGHRGARSLWPENSLTGFRNTLSLGCDAIEFDVHLTDAGELVVVHDPTLDRTTETTGEVRGLTPEARRATRLKDSDDTIPTLEDVLDVLATADGPHLHVEIKLDPHGHPYPGIAARIADLLTARRLAERAHLTSFDLGVLEDCRRHAPGISRLVSADRSWIDHRGGLPAFIEAVEGLVDLVALRHDFLAPNWAEACRLWPRERLCAWTVNDPGEMRVWLERGVGHLTSDRPDLAIAARGGVPA